MDKVRPESQSEHTPVRLRAGAPPDRNRWPRGLAAVDQVKKKSAQPRSKARAGFGPPPRRRLARDESRKEWLTRAQPPTDKEHDPASLKCQSAHTPETRRHYQWDFDMANRPDGVWGRERERSRA
jgi:hypothetical protein